METLVKKEDLKKALVANREGHRDIFEKAIEGYRKAALDQLNEAINRIKLGSLEQVYIQMPVPEDHTRDYDRIISMLEMEVREDVTLSEKHYAQYVLDDWDWKEHWMASNSAYTVMG